MSRRSQAFAEGTQAFTWSLERISQPAENRYKCTCENHPAIIGFGNSEQEAMRDAQSKITTAAENADLQLMGPSFALGQAPSE